MIRRILTFWLIYAASFAAIEFLFALFSDFDVFSPSKIRILLFVLSAGLTLAIITSLMNRRWSRICMYFALFAYAFYALFQSSFHDYMGYYVSFSTAKTTATNVTDYVLDFLKAIKFRYIAYFFPMLMTYFVIQKRWIRIPKRKMEIKAIAMMTAVLIFVHLLSLQSLNWFVAGFQVYTPKLLYHNPTQTTLAIKELGVQRYGIRDVIMLFHDIDSEIIIKPDDPINPDPDQKPDLTRKLKTDLWTDLAYRETDEKIKQIDDYLLKRVISSKNDMTGIFKDKNLVYIMVEAFDYMAIHPQLTPTLYRLMHEGFYFDDYYAVKASCATGESEFMGLVSLIPVVSACTPYEYYENEYPQSVFNLFKDNGYHVSSYHSYPDKFYPRTPWHTNMGSEWFYHSEQLQIPMLKGWPSDLTLLEKSYEVYSKQDRPFMAFVITAAMHFVYDSDSTLGNRYLDEVNQYMPNASMDIKRYMSKSIDFDRGLARLFELFEEDDLMDDTVFVLYADHHPFRINYNEIVKHTPYVDRSEGLSIDRSPLIIYHKNSSPKTISTPGSQIDILPTIANLFGLDFDPRIYIGQDLFSDLNNVVIFTNGSWKTEKGEFYATRQAFVPYDENDTYTEEEILKINMYVKNQFTISEEILKTDYFKYRKSILP